MKKVIPIIMSFIILSIDGFSQCAMCRATLENNVSNGEGGIASTINFGILYLFVMPYLLVGVIAYFWYKISKKNDSKKSLSSYFRKQMP